MYDPIDSTTTCSVATACQSDNTLPESDTDSYNCALVNCNSIVNKIADLKAEILDNIDI